MALTRAGLDVQLGTRTAEQAAPATTQTDRGMVLEVLARADTASRLQSMGVDPQQARVARRRYGCFAQFGDDARTYGYATSVGARERTVGFEINGTKGAIKFDFERMNELQYYDATLPRAVQGWNTIMVTHGADHPYVANWWPDAHIIGYEHGFINQLADILAVIGGKQPVVPLPDFEDAFKTQQVLEAAVVSAEQRRPVKIEEMQ